MYKLLRENLEKTVGQQISDSDFAVFSSYFYEKSFDKKSVIIEEGSISKYVYFIVEGACYSYIINEEGEKHAIQFSIEGYWITDLYSFFSGRKGIYNIETLENTKVLVSNRENFEKICCANQLFERFFRILIQNAFVSLQYRLAKTNSEIAENRYREFVSLYPQFVQRIPQYLIASYLGIKPQSLSRIRKEIVRK